MSDRFYYDHDLKLAYPSVTTVLGIISKGIGYENWLKKMAKEESDKITNDACDLGTRVHDLIEEYVNWTIAEGDLSLDILQKDDKINICFQAFLDWEKEHNVEYLKSELMVMSKDYGYAGRFDILAKVDGCLSLIDLKTSKAFYDTMGLQLSAYSRAYYEMFPDEPTIEKHYILRLDKVKGSPHFKEYNYDFHTFQLALGLWNWRNKWDEEKSREKYEKENVGR